MPNAYVYWHGGGGYWWKDYWLCWHGEGSAKNLICFVLKERYTLRFQTTVYIFNIFVYIIVPLNILKNGQNYEVYFATRAKKWCYWRNVGHRSPFIYYIITQGGGRGKPIAYVCWHGGREGSRNPLKLIM